MIDMSRPWKLSNPRRRLRVPICPFKSFLGSMLQKTPTPGPLQSVPIKRLEKIRSYLFGYRELRWVLPCQERVGFRGAVADKDFLL